MKEKLKSEQPPSAESIAQEADKGRDVSSHFTNAGRMMPALEIDRNNPNEAAIEELNED